MEEAKETQDMNAKANADADIDTNTAAHSLPGENTGVETTPDADLDTDLDTDTDTDTATDTDTDTDTDTYGTTDESPGLEAAVTATEIADAGKDLGKNAGEETGEEAEEETREDIATDVEAAAETAPTQEDTEIATRDEIPGEEPGDEFSKMMKDYDLKKTKAASRINGTIVDFIDDKVVVDIGQKTEGILNINELYDYDGSVKYKVGDTITVICKNINLTEGYITVSKKQVDLQDGWQKVRRAYEKKQPLPGRIVGLLEDNKGFKVDMGVEMFLPMSQADIKKIKSPPKLLGKEYQFKITRLNSREKNGVVSRRVLLEEEKENKIKALFDSLQVGSVIKG